MVRITNENNKSDLRTADDKDAAKFLSKKAKKGGFNSIGELFESIRADFDLKKGEEFEFARGEKFSEVSEKFGIDTPDLKKIVLGEFDSLKSFSTQGTPRRAFKSGASEVDEIVFKRKEFIERNTDSFSEPKRGFNIKPIPVHSHARRGTSGVISHRRLKPSR